MARSSATTVKEYLYELPPERRKVVAAVRTLVRKHLPKGYAEAMNWGMISYQIPLSRYPDTYNGQPLGYVGLAAQKNHYALYLMSAYAGTRAEQRLRDAWARTGRKLDMGKCCLRFRSLDDLETDAVADVIAAMTPDEYIAHYEAARGK